MLTGAQDFLGLRDVGIGELREGEGGLHGLGVASETRLTLYRFAIEGGKRGTGRLAARIFTLRTRRTSVDRNSPPPGFRQRTQQVGAAHDSDNTPVAQHRDTLDAVFLQRFSDVLNRRLLRDCDDRRRHYLADR